MTDWDEIYSHVISCTGWTWEQVGKLTIPRLVALQKYWKHNPPVHLLVKWFVKYEYKEPVSASSESGFAELLAMFPEGKI